MNFLFYKLQKNFLKKLISFFLFIFFIFSSSFIKAQSIDQLEKQISDLVKRKKELEQKAQHYRFLLENKNKEINSLENTIHYLTIQIERLENEINKTTLNIRQAEFEIKKMDLKILAFEEDIAHKKKHLGALMRRIYAQSRTSLLEIFLTNKTFSEFFNQRQNLNSLQAEMRTLILELKLNQEKIKEIQDGIKEKKLEMENLNKKLSFQQEDLSEQKAQKDKILIKSKGQQKLYSQMLSEIQKEEANLRIEIAKLEALVEKSRAFIIYLKAGKIPPKGTKWLSWPLDNPIITQGYGMTPYAKTGVYGGKGHNGIDMSSGLGSEVKAAADGKVIAKNQSLCPNYAKTREGRQCSGGWGNWLAIEHEGGFVTVYAHLYSLSHKKVGEEVKAGEVIGQEGSSGYSTGSHLHFSLYSEFFTYKSPTGELLFKYGDGSEPTGTLNPLDYL